MWRAPQTAVVGGLGLIGVIMVLDLLSGPDTNLTGTLAAAPFIAATLASVRQTQLVSVVAVVAGLVLLGFSPPPPEAGVIRGAVLVLAAVLAPYVARARVRREERIGDLTRVAEIAQNAVLTPLPAVSRSLAVSARYLSASRGALIGGDLYAMVEGEHGVRLIIGDVRGKGLDAVALAALVLSSFREAAHRADLREVVLWMDRRLAVHLTDEDFVTALLADIDDDGTVRMVTCGHYPPVLVHSGRRSTVQALVPASPFGLRPQPQVAALRLEVGDRLLLYTDGLVEARAPDGSFVPLDAVLDELAVGPFDTALDDVVTRLRDRAADMRDDLALLLVQYQGPPAPTEAEEQSATVIDLRQQAGRRGEQGRGASPRTRAAPPAQPPGFSSAESVSMQVAT